MLDKIPPYEFKKYVFAGRCAVITTSSLELLMILSGSLGDSCALAKLIHFVFLSASVAVSAHNVSLDVDGREEMKKVLTSQENEVRGKSAALLLTPAVSALLLFLTVSGHAFFSLFVLVHLLSALGQLGIEAYEVKQNGEGVRSTPPPPSSRPARSVDPLASPIKPPTDKKAVAPTFDPQYQTLHNLHNEIFTKK